MYDEQAPDDTPLFPDFNLARYGREVNRAALRLKLGHLGVCPHVFRHSAASNDVFMQRRSLDEVQKRGRWAVHSSVVRYEKAAILLQQLKKLSSHQQRAARTAASRFPGMLVAAVR